MYNATIENAYKRLKTWLNVGSEADVTDIILDYLNRGQRRIARERDWDFLEATTELTLDSDNSASLPALDTIIEVYVDSDGDSKPDGYLYNEGRIGSGYTIKDTFDQSTGWTKVITFFQDVSNSPIVKYKRLVEDFTADYASQYSIFSEDLVLRGAQLEHLEEAGLDNNIYQTILTNYNRELKKAIMAYEDANVDMRSEVRDIEGHRIITENFSLDGDDSINSSDRLDRDVLT